MFTYCLGPGPLLGLNALILNSTPEGDSGGGKVPGGFHGVLKFRGVGGGGTASGVRECIQHT